MPPRRKRQKVLEGVPASPGIVIGKVFLVDRQQEILEPKTIKPEKVEAEVARFLKAVNEAKIQLRRFRKKVLREVGEAEAQVFDSHLLLLDDPIIIEGTTSGIREKHRNAEFVFNQCIRTVVNKLQKISDNYIKERSTDIEDVSRRVINILRAHDQDVLDNLPDPVVVVANDLGPSDTAHMSRSKVTGFATDKGGPTSHTAIMAKSLELPAVVGCYGLTKEASTDDQIIVDGIKGRVIVNPSRQTLSEYQDALHNYQVFISALARHGTQPAETLDGYTIELAANIELASEASQIFKHGAERVGLFRTEFLYLNRPSGTPSEEEQFEAYRTVAAAVQPQPVVIRTLDLGGDKLVSSVPIAHEFNPYLGLRAIRLCLEHPEMFRQQLRAILRASVFGNIKIMIPMVTGIGEVKSAKAILNECRAELRKHKIAFKAKIEVGIMVETPAAAVAADQLVDEVDFFSIGTNDLIQYTLAVDRGNEKVAPLYEPYHPAVLRLIDHVIRAAQYAGIRVSLCGEMAGDPLMALMLLGMGVDELSMSAVRVPLIKEVIRHAYLTDMRKMAQGALKLRTSEEIRCLVTERLSGLLPHSEWIFGQKEKSASATG